MNIKLIGFSVMLRHNLIRRATDGFAIGYNIIFPFLIIFLFGLLSKNGYSTSFTSYHYYIVVSIPFCTAMAIVTAAYGCKDDAFAKTAQRVLVSPISVEAIILSKIISCTIVISVCNAIVLLGASAIWKFEIIENIVSILILLTSISFLISTVGTWIGLGMKNFMVVKNIMTFPIGILAIVAGTFFPIGTLNNKIQLLINLSPLTWVNRSIFLALYDNSTALLWCLIAIFIIIGGFFTKISIVTFKKEEYLNGDLPSYEK